MGSGSSQVVSGSGGVGAFKLGWSMCVSGYGHGFGLTRSGLECYFVFN